MDTGHCMHTERHLNSDGDAAWESWEISCWPESVGLLAIFLRVVVLHFQIANELSLDTVPVLNSIIVVVFLEASWDGRPCPALLQALRSAWKLPCPCSSRGSHIAVRRARLP